MPKLHTHIVVNKGESAILFRAVDGMVLANRHASVVNFGEEPQRPSQRQFLDSSFGEKFIRTLADHDDGCESAEKCRCGAFRKRDPAFETSASIDYRDAEKRIVSGDEAMALVGSRR